jgi:hypothetical protein
MTTVGRLSRLGFVLVAWLFVGCVVVQLYLTGLGVFAGYDNFLLHRDFGYLFGVLTLVLLLLAAVGRMPLRLIVASGVLLGLFALQSVFVFLRTDAPYIAALHAVNGVVILLVGLWVAWRSTEHVRQAPAAD